MINDIKICDPSVVKLAPTDHRLMVFVNGLLQARELDYMVHLEPGGAVVEFTWVPKNSDALQFMDPVTGWRDAYTADGVNARFIVTHLFGSVDQTEPVAEEPR